MRLNFAYDIKCGSKQVKRVYQGANTVWPRIPNDYTLCEYLESTGTQWIETDIVPKLGLWLQVRYMPQKDSLATVISAEGSGTTSLIILPQAYGATYVKYFTGGGASAFNLYSSSYLTLTFYGGLGEYYVVRGADNFKLYNYEEKTKTKTQEEDTLWLFKRQTTATGFMGNTRIYFVRSTDFCLLPCLDASGVPCFYDTIGQKTYYNTGTGTFSYKIAI